MPRSLSRWTHRRLLAYFGRPEWIPPNDPLDELIGTVLSQHTSDINADRAFAALKRTYRSWEEVRDAPRPELVQVIRGGGLPVVKAGRIQAILHTLTADDGRVLFPDLKRLGRKRARQWLTSLPGVGKKTASCVLLFGSGLPAIPVDTHVHRVALRMGLVPARSTPDQTTDALEAAISPGEHYAFHVNLIRLGREVCRAQRPRCQECVLRARCDFFSQHIDK